MPSTLETTTAIQDKVLEGMQVGQKAVVDMVRSWAEIVDTMSTRLPELAATEYPARSGQYLETAFGFSERVMNSQREFVSQIFEAAMPATRGPASAQAAATQAAKPTGAKS